MTETSGKAATKRRLEPQFRRVAIVDAAAELFFEMGYAQTKLEHISARIGFRKPVIYESFSGKQDVLAGVAAAGIEGGLAILGGKGDAGAGAAELVDLLVEVAEFFIRHHRHILVYLREEKNLAPEDAERIRARRRDFDLVLMSYLERASAAGQIRIGDPRLTAYTLGGLITWPVFWFNPERTFSEEDIVAQVRADLLRLLGLD